MKEAGEGLKEPKSIVLEDKSFHPREGNNSLDFGLCFSLCFIFPLRFSFLLFILLFSGLFHLNCRK